MYAFVYMCVCVCERERMCLNVCWCIQSCLWQQERFTYYVRALSFPLLLFFLSITLSASFVFFLPLLILIWLVYLVEKVVSPVKWRILSCQTTFEGIQFLGFVTYILCVCVCVCAQSAHLCVPKVSFLNLPFFVLFFSLMTTWKALLVPLHSRHFIYEELLSPKQQIWINTFKNAIQDTCT